MSIFCCYSVYPAFMSVMYTCAREEVNVKTNTDAAETTEGSLRTVWEKFPVQQTPVACQPQAIMMVHSTPSGEKIQCESFLINVSHEFLFCKCTFQVDCVKVIICCYSSILLKVVCDM